MSVETYLAALVASGKVQACRGCGETGALRIVRSDSGPHFGKVVCDNCRERFVTWAPNPNAPKRKRSSSSTNLMPVIREAFGEEPLFCELCLRDERDLPDGLWLEAHHVIEHQDGGTDHISNLRPYCNHCHQAVHLIRKMVGGEKVAKPQTWVEEEVEHA